MVELSADRSVANSVAWKVAQLVGLSVVRLVEHLDVKQVVYLAAQLAVGSAVLMDAK